ERDAAQAVVDSAAALVSEHVDLDAVLAVAQAAAPLDAEPWSPVAALGLDAPTDLALRPRIAVAAGRAFTFRYAETTELLAAAGCDVIGFDPLTDPALPPDTAGLYLGGGFPEMYATDLAANTPLLAQVRDAVRSALPTYAECAGLLYLCRTLDGHPLAGALPLTAGMSPRLTLGYNAFTAAHDGLVVRAGETYRFHEFHRTTIEPADDHPHVGTSVQASYHHVHWAGHPEQARRFAAAARAFAGRAR
ncbi:MAG: cobyrinic acid a,c-diamide synthase, partial [Propionibacteriaceae bacterium]|nr:cobyrinic acid a,c-diamide synthase [Propionibacteriaceae bacterium]